MVATSSGAGGAGSLSIAGSIDTSMIERGFTRVKQGLESVKGNAKSFNADLSRMGVSAGRLAKGLLTVGIAGTTAMIGLASKAPATAGAMARIKVQMDRLSRSIGRTLQPEFERFAVYFERFVSFADAHPNILKGFILSTGAIAGIRALAFLLGITITPAMVGALASIAAIGVTAYAGQKYAEKQIDKANEALGLNQSPAYQTEMTAGGYARLIQDKMMPGESNADLIGRKDRITEAGFVPSGGTMSLREEDRRWMLLTWWDAIWS